MKSLRTTATRRRVFSVTTLACCLFGAPGAVAAREAPQPQEPPLPGAERKTQPDRQGPPGHGDAHAPRFRRGQAPWGLWRRMSDDDRAEVLEFIETEFPTVFVDLQRLEQHNPELFAQRMRRLAPEMRRLMELAQLDPVRAELEINERTLDVRIRMVTHKYRLAEDDDVGRENMRATLRDLLKRVFEVRHRRRELEIEELARRLDELRQRHVAAASARDRLIDEELAERADPDRPVHRGPRRGLRHPDN